METQSLWLSDAGRSGSLKWNEYIPLVLQESVFGCAGIPVFSSALKAAPY